MLSLTLMGPYEEQGTKFIHIFAAVLKVSKKQRVRK